MGRAASLALALALVACAKPRPSLLGEPIPTACDGATGERRDEAVEECVGWFLDRLLSLSRNTYIDERVTTYVAGVGQRLVRASGDHQRWKFVVSDDTGVQAYAGLSRTISINRGALALLRDEAELAAVLGHEMAHVLGAHLHENYRGFREGDIGRSDESQRHADRYARDDEIQADEVAVLLLAKAGYDATAVERMLRALAATSPRDGEEDTDHHPRWIERIARVQALAALQPRGDSGAGRFRERMSELVVGDDPRVATLVGNAAVFSHAGFAVDLPPHATATVDGPDIRVELDDSSGFGLRALDRKLARALRVQLTKDPDDTMVIIDGSSLSLMITAVGSDARLVAKRLRASVRAPRPDELRAIRPTRIDLSAPRVLWQP